MDIRVESGMSGPVLGAFSPITQMTYGAILPTAAGHECAVLAGVFAGNDLRRSPDAIENPCLARGNLRTGSEPRAVGYD